MLEANNSIKYNYGGLKQEIAGDIIDVTAENITPSKTEANNRLTAEELAQASEVVKLNSEPISMNQFDTKVQGAVDVLRDTARKIGKAALVGGLGISAGLGMVFGFNPFTLVFGGLGAGAYFLMNNLVSKVGEPKTSKQVIDTLKNSVLPEHLKKALIGHVIKAS